MPTDSLQCPSILFPLTYPPKQFMTRIRVQRSGAKIDPRSRPILVWRPYKTPSPPASQECHGVDWRGTWSYRRRRQNPRDLAVAPRGPRRRPRTPPPAVAVAVAPADLAADPLDLAVATALGASFYYTTSTHTRTPGHFSDLPDTYYRRRPCHRRRTPPAHATPDGCSSSLCCFYLSAVKTRRRQRQRQLRGARTANANGK